MSKPNENLLKAAINASNTIVAFYDWVDRVEKAGGTTCISGVAECNAMIKSLNKNKARLDKLVMAPLQKELEKAQ